MIDPETGAAKRVDVSWRDSLRIEVRQKRARPFGYVLPAGEIEAARHLRLLGVTVLRLTAPGRSDGERYRITAREERRKEDVRRDDEDATPSVIRIATVVEPAAVAFDEGDFYVPLDQPLANVIAAALEPETQSSFAANRLLRLPDTASEPVLPLYRITQRLAAPAVAWSE
jgi:hypothetical protein